MRMLLDIFLQTLRTLWAHKLRSFLTMFGIAWGVGSLLLLVVVGEGFRSGQRRQLNNIGENIMFIFGGRVPAVPGSQISARPYQLAIESAGIRFRPSWAKAAWASSTARSIRS